jgi:serine phosphatase RsbU (regulator of sigma subunit)
LRAARCRSAAEILDSVFNEVQRFSRGEQADDLTLLMLKLEAESAMTASSGC